MAIAQVNGAAIYHEIHGEGFPILFIHAGIADSGMWDLQIAEFKHHYQTIRFDLRGFGRSEIPPGRFSNVEDVAGLLDALGLQKAALVGCSFGGLVALDFALEYPDRVTVLVLAAPSVSGEPPSNRIQRFWEVEEEAINSGNYPLAADLNLKFWVDGPLRTAEEVNPVIRERVRAMQLAAFQIMVPDDAEPVEVDPPANRRLDSIRAPTLVIVGELDLEEKIDLARRLAVELPGPDMILIPDAAHMVNMESPKVFNKALADFFRDLKP